MFIDTFGIAQGGGKKRNNASAILGKKKNDLKENELAMVKKYLKDKVHHQ